MQQIEQNLNAALELCIKHEIKVYPNYDCVLIIQNRIELIKAYYEMIRGLFRKDVAYLVQEILNELKVFDLKNQNNVMRALKVLNDETSCE